MVLGWTKITGVGIRALKLEVGLARQRWEEPVAHGWAILAQVFLLQMEKLLSSVYFYDKVTVAHI